MYEFCVMCGSKVLSESNSQVCRTCELTTGINFETYTCPECGETMTIYYRHVVAHQPDRNLLEVALIYHCDKCGCDWDNLYTQDWGDKKYSGLTRHFWG